MSEIANYFLYRNAEGETGLSANTIDDLNLDDLFALRSIIVIPA